MGDIFTGFPGNSNRNKCVNSLVMFIKYVIFHSRAQGHVPSCMKNQKCIADFIEEEKTLATKAGKLNLHLQKWEELKVNKDVNVSRYDMSGVVRV